MDIFSAVDIAFRFTSILRSLFIVNQIKIQSKKVKTEDAYNEIKKNTQKRF
jgi:hypothetical protein